MTTTFPTGNLQVGGTLNVTGVVSGTGFVNLLAPYALLAGPTFTAPTAVDGNGTGAAFTVSDTGNANGAVVHLVGNGATTPGKYIEVKSGVLSVVNSAFATTILGLTDSSILSLLGGVVPITVSSIGALRNVLKTATPYVFVAGYYAIADGGGGLYAYNSADTTSADNFGSIIVGADGGRWYLTQTTPLSARQFGAKGDGTTDDKFSIQQALNAAGTQSSKNSVVLLPSGTYRAASGIIIPTGVWLQGDGADDAIIVGDLAISPIVTAVGGGDGEGVMLSGVTVTRATGAFTTAAVGIAITSNNSYSLQDVMVLRCGVAYQVGVIGQGTSLGTHLLRCGSGQISSYHLQINNAVETTATECRFGRNGGADVACAAYVNINGSQVDTVRFIACQFNQSGANATYIVYFTGYASNANGIISLEACHSEAWGTAILAADVASANIQRIKIQGCTINGTGQFYAGPAASLISLVVSGSTLEGNVSFTLDQQTTSIVTGNLISGVALFNQGQQAVTGNYFQSAVTLQGVSGGTTFVGNRIAGGLTNTMTGTTAVASNA